MLAGWLYVIEGYITLPCGIVFEWCYVPASSGGDKNYTWYLPKPFQHSWFLAQGLKIEDVQSADWIHGNPRRKDSNSSIVFAIYGKTTWQLFAFGY